MKNAEKAPLKNFFRDYFRKMPIQSNSAPFSMDGTSTKIKNC